MSQKKCPQIFISCGELSGDMYGALLVKAIKKKEPNCSFSGLTGPKLQKAGVHSVGDMTRINTIGFIEPILKLKQFYQFFSIAKKILLKQKPDIVIAIDSQGFNLPLFKFCKKIGIKTCYFIAPQEWQWGTEKGGKKVCELCDKILCVFQKENHFYKKLGGNTKFIGHPLATHYKNQLSENKLTKKGKIISLFPGSRDQEVYRLSPLFFEVAKKTKP